MTETTKKGIPDFNPGLLNDVLNQQPSRKKFLKARLKAEKRQQEQAQKDKVGKEK